MFTGPQGFFFLLRTQIHTEVTHIMTSFSNAYPITTELSARAHTANNTILYFGSFVKERRLWPSRSPYANPFYFYGMPNDKCKPIRILLILVPRRRLKIIQHVVSSVLTSQIRHATTRRFLCVKRACEPRKSFQHLLKARSGP